MATNSLKMEPAPREQLTANIKRRLASLRESIDEMEECLGKGDPEGIRARCWHMHTLLSSLHLDATGLKNTAASPQVGATVSTARWTGTVGPSGKVIGKVRKGGVR